MSPLSWKVAGLIALVAAVPLAVLSIAQAFDAIGPATVVPTGRPESFRDWTDLAALMRALVLAVLAGVAFFCGLACLFWGALAEGRLQRAEIIGRLAALREHG